MSDGKGKGAPAIGIPQDEPLQAVIAAVEGLQRKALAEMGSLVTKLSGDVAATAAMAESSSRAKAEQIITEAGAWAAQQIRDAGQEAAARIELERDIVHGDLNTFLRTLWMQLITVFVCSGMSLGAILVWIFMK